MNASAPLDGEAAALARLREHERALDRRLEAARADAERVRAGAREECDHLKQRAETSLREEAEALREQQARERERALAAIGADAAARIQALRRHAERNREATLEWLLSRVAGEEAP